jgi:hypothetical protein
MTRQALRVAGPAHGAGNPRQRDQQPCVQPDEMYTPLARVDAVISGAYAGAAIEQASASSKAEVK